VHTEVEIDKKRLHRYNFCLDSEIIEEAKEIAWSKKKTVSQVIRELLKAYVNANRDKS
jgi:GDP-D-mannose dehydratase